MLQPRHACPAFVITTGPWCSLPQLPFVIALKLTKNEDARIITANPVAGIQVWITVMGTMLMVIASLLNLSKGASLLTVRFFVDKPLSGMVSIHKI